MSEPSEYLGAAAILSLRETKVADLPTDRRGLKDLLEEDYNLTLEPRHVELLVSQLRKWSMVEVLDDEYAGEMLKLARARTDAAWNEADSQILNSAWEGGSSWFERVFNNSAFWQNLERQNEFPDIGDEANSDRTGPIPAADRLVTLSHNQFSEIEPKSSEIIDALSADNGDPDQLTFRERVLGQIKAGRELLRAGVFDAQLFYTSMVIGLKMLAERYASKSIGILAVKLLEVIAEHLGDKLF